MKKLLLLMLLLCTTASATILPATGVDEDFKAWTGIEAAPAVILCQSLSVYDERGDQGGRKVETLYYTGKDIPVIESWDGYAKIYYADGTKTGWVRNEYLLMNPAWYLCDEDTQVYAYPDTMAPRVAWLEKGSQLPILTQWEGGEGISGWACVSLRGAAGWIRKTPRDTADETWFRPEMLADIGAAVLRMGEDAVGSYDAATMEQLAVLLTNVRDEGGAMAGCPFAATLTVLLADGQEIQLQLATDSCCVYRVDGRDYSYARNLVRGDDGPDNAALFGLFGLDTSSTWGN